MQIRSIAIPMVVVACLGGLAGCSSAPSSEEQKALQALQPKPITDAQQKQLDALHQKFGNNPTMGGRSNPSSGK